MWAKHQSYIYSDQLIGKVGRSGAVIVRHVRVPSKRSSKMISPEASSSSDERARRRWSTPPPRRVPIAGAGVGDGEGGELRYRSVLRAKLLDQQGNICSAGGG